MLASAARDCTATANFSEALGLCWNIMKTDTLKTFFDADTFDPTPVHVAFVVDKVALR